MLPEPGTLLLLCLFGGIVALDSTSVGQFMISRPLVAATVGGWIAGNPVEGAMLGLILEAFHLTVLPVGAARYPEGGPSAVAAGGVYAVSGAVPGALLTAVVFSLAWAWVAGESMRQLRQWNIRLAIAPDERSGIAAELERRHLLALVLDFARGFLLVAAGALLLVGLLTTTHVWWGFDEERISWAFLGAALTGVLAATLRLFGGRRTRLFLLGALCGLLTAVLR